MSDTIPRSSKGSALGGRDFLANNDAFSSRFFPPAVRRFPNALRVETPNSLGTYRVLVMGESAAMGDPAPAFGASRYLEVLLRRRFPGQRFEIVNTAFTAINSHVILPIARECALQQGDLWIIYMGNNEMVGPFGAATVFGAQAPPLGLVRLDLALQRSRVGQLLAALARRLRSDPHAARSWQGMEMFLKNQLAADDPRRERVYRDFQANLETIVRAGLGGGVKSLLNTVAVNLRDCPPFGSLASANQSVAQRAAWGASHHYMPPAKYVSLLPDVVARLSAALDQFSPALERGAAWTTDAAYRETAEAIEFARAEGVLAVEMEAAATPRNRGHFAQLRELR